jgi:basic amino acid/polyamine antiporter, APA family
VLYVAVSLVVTGMVKYTDIKIDAPLAEALRSVGQSGIATVISVGALVGLTTVMMILMLGQSRVFFAMSRDRLLPPVFAKVSPRFGTPLRTTILTSVVVTVISTFVPLTQLAELVNIGTLFAFVLVAIGVLVLRRTRPDLKRAFRCPGRPGRARARRVLPDAEPSRRDVGPVLRVDGPWLRVLPRIRRPAQPTRDGPELLPRSRHGSRGEAQA